MAAVEKKRVKCLYFTKECRAKALVESLLLAKDICWPKSSLILTVV